MEFVTDKQTLVDLNLLGRYKNNSIFSLYNHTVTVGGNRLLEKMFNNPLADSLAINTRKDIFLFFKDLDISLPFDAKEFETVENYLRNMESKNRFIAALNISKAKVLNIIVKEKDYAVLYEGLKKSIELLSKLRDLIGKLSCSAEGTPYEPKAKEIEKFLNSDLLSQSYLLLKEDDINFKNVFRFDYVYRGYLNDLLNKLLSDIYELDVYITVSKVGKENNFIYAQAIEKDQKIIDIRDVYHPCVPNAIGNDIKIDGEKNVFFLTGANMAGKSTFMKSFSIACYLAHMGFPVAAKQMTFSAHDGIYTSINVPDNLAMGYSHFYAEVLRVKHVAEEVASDKQLIVIFDELFKGTNVKDAYDGTVSIVEAFSKRKGTFIISTHIMEAGETLKETNNKLFFKYLPTVMKGSVPTYPYKLKDGITDDRHGMIIIQNEKILDIINLNV
ncbi:hypothetical protein L3073_19385 [Ancylomarina sp. DW003]|nr:hypothetical protein [Ancylomarina sp. DW003]MDE5424381.1 hypothetical protein [Ancylomarina sp. DW003]